MLVKENLGIPFFRTTSKKDCSNTSSFDTFNVFIGGHYEKIISFGVERAILQGKSDEFNVELSYNNETLKLYSFKETKKVAIEGLSIPRDKASLTLKFYNSKKNITKLNRQRELMLNTLSLFYA